jgi:hypothetical protein
MNINETDKKKIEETRKKIKMNILGSQLSNQNVASALVIIKNNLTYEIKDNNVKTISKPTSIESTNELIDILTSVILKDGVVIKQDGTMQPYQYITNPLEHLILTVPNYENIYRYHEYEIYTHVLIIIVNTTIETNKENLNKNATYLAGKPTFGDVFIGMYKKPDYNEAQPYSSISIPLLNKIINIRSKSTQITTNKTNAEHEYINFEKLLELDIDKHKNHATINIDTIDGVSLNIK